MPPDAAEFETLVRRYARLVASAARRVCGRRRAELVPDVEQEVYLALWKRLGRGGNEIAHPTSYIYKMALTAALAVVRRHRQDEPLDDERQSSTPVPRGEPDGLEPAERRRLVDELLGSLEADEARALRAWLAGFNHLEVARLYGWTESVARHRIYRSLDRLRARSGGPDAASRPEGGGR
jgi:RNA polymerase sigma factor (sigma-70 family)